MGSLSSRYAQSVGRYLGMESSAAGKSVVVPLGVVIAALPSLFATVTEPSAPVMMAPPGPSMLPLPSLFMTIVGPPGVVLTRVVWSLLTKVVLPSGFVTVEPSGLVTVMVLSGFILTTVVGWPGLEPAGLIMSL